MMENGIRFLTHGMVEVIKYGPMVQFMMDIGKMIKQMGEVD